MPERLSVALSCSVCGARNYRTTRAKTSGATERLVKRKFCKTCGKHTEHRETK